MKSCGVRGADYWARQRKAGARIAHRVAVLSIAACLMPLVAAIVVGAATIKWINDTQRKSDESPDS